MTLNNNSKYIFRLNGEMSGKGIYYFKTGDKYEGQFLNNMKHGKGTYYYHVNYIFVYFIIHAGIT